MELFFPERTWAAGIHPTAVIAASAKVDATAHIGPHCVVGERVKIGARAVLPVLVGLVRPGGRLLVLVKPQFELPAHMVPAGGVVADDGARWQAVRSVQDAARDLGLNLLATAESELSGPMGNREVFLLLERPSEDVGRDDDRR